jgi:hypothetical protein
LLRTIWLEELRGMSERFREYMNGTVDSPWEPWVGAPAMTLAAFAIENLLKGLVIAADPTLIQPSEARPEQLLHERLRTHELSRLASHADVALSTGEQALLVRLTEFVRWAGRYPFPVDAMESAPREGAEEGGVTFTSDWFDTLDALFQRLRGELAEAAVRKDRDRTSAAADEKRRRRPELMTALTLLRRIEIEPDVTVFETDLPDEPGAAISCTCGVTFNLNQRRPAGICRCGTLYYGEKRGVAGRVRFSVETFPA